MQYPIERFRVQRGRDDEHTQVNLLREWFRVLQPPVSMLDIKPLHLTLQTRDYFLAYEQARHLKDIVVDGEGVLVFV